MTDVIEATVAIGAIGAVGADARAHQNTAIDLAVTMAMPTSTPPADTTAIGSARIGTRTVTVGAPTGRGNGTATGVLEGADETKTTTGAVPRAIVIPWRTGEGLGAVLAGVKEIMRGSAAEALLPHPRSENRRQT